MFIHPDCPCTAASLDELRTVARGAARVPAIAFVVEPGDRRDDWSPGQAFAGASRMADRDGLEARRFGAKTSVYVVVYDAAGQLRFAGRITGSRGHSGDNVGRQAVFAALAGASGVADHPVFGCSFEDAAPTERARADALFADAHERLHARTSRMFLGLLAGQWVFAITLAALTALYTFAGSTRSVHMHLQLAVFLGGAINVLPCILLVTDQIRGPLFNPIEMALPGPEQVPGVLAKAGYRPVFAAAFPGDRDPLTFDRAALALASFERTLLTPARWDQFLDGDTAALSAAEVAGAKLFADIGCVQCHTGTLVGGSMFQRVG